MELWTEALAGAKIGAVFVLAFGVFFALFSAVRMAVERLRKHMAWRRSLKPWANLPRAYGTDGREIQSSIDRRVEMGGRP